MPPASPGKPWTTLPPGCRWPTTPRSTTGSYSSWDEGFGLFSAPLHLGTFEFLCRGMMGCRDLAEALERATRFLRQVLPDLSVSVRRSREAATLEIAEPAPLRPDRNDPCRVFAFE